MFEMSSAPQYNPLHRSSRLLASRNMRQLRCGEGAKPPSPHNTHDTHDAHDSCAKLPCAVLAARSQWVRRVRERESERVLSRPCGSSVGILGGLVGRGCWGGRYVHG